MYKRQLLNRKIRGTIGYYYRYTRDAFLSKKVSVVNGVEAYTVNEGNLRNQGYELTLNFMPVNTATSLNGQMCIRDRDDSKMELCVSDAGNSSLGFPYIG